MEMPFQKRMNSEIQTDILTREIYFLTHQNQSL